MAAWACTAVLACACDGGQVADEHRALAAAPILAPPVIPAVVTTIAPAEVPVDLRGQRTAHLSGGQVVAVADALNAGEIALARLALEQVSTREAQSFAQVMIRDHGQALQLLAQADSAVGPRAPTTLLEHTERAGQQQMAALRGLRGAAFDRAYLDGQVQMHQAALDLVDGQLLPAASDPLLQQVLRQMRATIAEHLQIAIQVRQKLYAAA